MYHVSVDPLTEFYDSIRSPVTKDRYKARLDIFLKHIEMDGANLSERAKTFVEKAHDLEWTTFVINNYMRYQKERAEQGEISESTILNFYKPIRLFLEMNDITGLNWKKITRRIPKGRKYGKDRAPTLSEIKKILDYPDRRIKPVILLMVSSGIRVGAWDYLNWSHISPIKKDDKIVSAKILVYAGTNDEYYSFVTPEAYNAINEYMEYRKSNGELIDGGSPVIRDLFHPDREGKGEPHLPKRLKASGIKRLIEKSIWGTGLRKKLGKNQRRHPFQAAHGFRKFFKTTCEKSMRSLCVEMQMGHSVGVTDSYYKPTEDELLNEYLKAVGDLTILDMNLKPPHEDIEELKRSMNEQMDKQAKQIESLQQALADAQDDRINHDYAKEQWKIDQEKWKEFNKRQKFFEETITKRLDEWHSLYTEKEKLLSLDRIKENKKR